MQTANSLDLLDQSLLRILSAYDELTPLELWYELGEDDAAKETVSEKEVGRKLESLGARGYVERVVREGGNADSMPVKYRIKARGDTPEDKEVGTEES
jgi:hypothetical protein